MRFSDDGHLVSAWLRHDTTLDGQRCRGTGYKGWSVLFHPSGRLAFCFLAEMKEFDGVPCINGTFLNEIRGGGKSAVRFRENGTIESCQAGRDVVRNGIGFRKWELVHFDEYGKARRPPMS